MRTIKLSDGSEVTIRPMTRKEIQAGKEHGFIYLGWRPKEAIESFDAACDYAIGTQFPDKDFPNPDQLDIFDAIRKETYPDKEEEKNLPTSGRPAQTPNTANGAQNA